MSQWIYEFYSQTAVNPPDHAAELLGNKGLKLQQLKALGLPVPPGFTLSTQVHKFYQENQAYPPLFEEDFQKNLRALEKAKGETLGDPNAPLLISIRSGAAVSMPGMMDTVLNVGLNDDVVKGMIASGGQADFIHDCYSRLIQMYGEVVLKISPDLFEKIHAEQGDSSDKEELIKQFKDLIQEQTENPFPQDLNTQIWTTLKAIFESWDNERAQIYRKMNEIPDHAGTAVTLQSMVFGNKDSQSATGVVFSRDPSTGEKILYGEYLPQAQGEDVVAGRRTPNKIQRSQESNSSAPTLENEMPELFAELKEVMNRLDTHYRDMQDVEFTIESGKLWMLQTRSGQRTAQAGVKIAVDLVEENLLTPQEAVLRVNPKTLEALFHPVLDVQERPTPVGTGMPASPGVVSGHVAFTVEEVMNRHENGEKSILIRHTTNADDIQGIRLAEGTLTAHGGMTSHAAVVARGMGKPCVVGLENLIINEAYTHCTIRGHRISSGDIITLDGTEGDIFQNELPTKKAPPPPEYKPLMEWVDSIRGLKVRTNAETVSDVKMALSLGAEGIGLCRTEHMFFEPEKIRLFQKMVLSNDNSTRQSALDALFEHHKQDFKNLFQELGDLPITVRLLDPPLHEFLPNTDSATHDLAEALNIEASELNQRISGFHETNPMLGHRGCRLGVTHPEIYEMQFKAIFDAAAESPSRVNLEIMVPLIGSVKEFTLIQKIALKCSKMAEEKAGKAVPYLLGTMIELPQAALKAGSIAERVDFFSFGTNDLTQMCLGISRDDFHKFNDAYLEKGIFPADPFVQLDTAGVGSLVRMAAELGRRSDPKLKLGVCGEHAGDPESIEFFEKIGLDYISCSPYRVPIARLAAAQATLKLYVQREQAKVRMGIQ